MTRYYMDLICWQKAMDLVTEIYRLTKQLPKEEVFGLASQLRRAAVSIPSNIAEGQGRLSKGEFRTFLGNARGSLSELETQIIICKNLIAFAENSYLNEGKWVSRESFQGAGFLIVSVPIHDP